MYAIYILAAVAVVAAVVVALAIAPRMMRKVGDALDRFFGE